MGGGVRVEMHVDDGRALLGPKRRREGEGDRDSPDDVVTLLQGSARLIHDAESCRRRDIENPWRICLPRNKMRLSDKHLRRGSPQTRHG